MATSKRGDILTRLREDHRTIKDLLKKLDETTERGAATRTRLLDRIAKELEIHTIAEEKTFYDAYHQLAEKKDDEEIYFEANEEHHVVDLVLPELKGTDPASPVFGAKASVLKELVEHHIKEEEGNMFKRARRLFTKEQLQEIGEKFVQKKRELNRR